MSIDFSSETAIQLLISFVIGTAIGIEREFRSKAAGLRTMIMICLGSTLFMEISLAVGGATPDRIASNIITGIGFLGAGVIFKDGLTISGITTATTIWITAALGMAVGAGEYFIAMVGSIVVLVVLLMFEKIQILIARTHQERVYKVIFHGSDTFITVFQDEIEKLKLRYRRERDIKDNENNILLYAIYGSEKKLDQLNAFLKNAPQVSKYEY